MRKRSETKLEELLRELPKVKDGRHPNEIYQNIASRSKKAKLPSWLLPGAAATAVVLLLFILSPALSGWQNMADQSEGEESSTEEQPAMLKESNHPESGSNDTMENTLFADEEVADRASEESALKVESPTEPTSVYSSDLEQFNAMTYPIPDKNAQVVVPVTVLIEKNENKTWFEQFEDTMPMLSEEEWGLAEYYPLNATFGYDQTSKIVNINVPTDHQYGLGSAAETMFVSTLKNLFPVENVEQLTLTTDGETGISLGNYGELYELENKGSNQQAYFFYYEGESPEPYIVPTEDAFESIAAALSEMTQDQVEPGLRASLPKEVYFDLSDGGNDRETLKLKLKNQKKLDDTFVYSLEAIALTAKSFGYRAVKIENAGVDKIGPFNLSEEIRVPIAPNKKIIDSN